MARTRDPHAAAVKSWAMRRRHGGATQSGADWRLGDGTTSDAKVERGRPIPGAKMIRETWADGTPASPKAQTKIGSGPTNPAGLRDKSQYWTAIYRQGDVTEAEVDGVIEAAAFHAALEESRAFYGDNSGDARWIRADDGDPRSPQSDFDKMSLSVTTVFVANPKDHGAGSGGTGSAKIFWTPYSIPDREKRLGYEHGGTAANSFGVDPIYVTAHELHHALGYHSELDQSSDVVGVAAHLRLMAEGMHPKAARLAARDGALNVVSGLWVGAKGKRGSQAKRKFRYLFKRYPEQLRRLLCDDPRTGEKNGYYSDSEFDQMIEKAHGKDR